MRKLLLYIFLVILGCSPGPTAPKETIPEVYVPTPTESITTTYGAANSILDAAGIGVKWEDPNSDFAQKAVDENKWTILWFYAEGCQYCQAMEQNAFHDLAIINSINEHFVPVRFNIEEHPEKFYYFVIRPFADQMSIIPSTVFISPRGEAVTVRGVMPSSKLSGVLNQILNHYGIQEIVDQR